MFVWNSLIVIPAPFMNLVSMIKKETIVSTIPKIQSDAPSSNCVFNLRIIIMAYTNIIHAVIIPGEYGFFN